jgi:hypothetical protein
MGEPAMNSAPGVPQTRTPESMLGRWPTIVCDGWMTPNHPRRVIRAGDPGAGISYGICPICAAAVVAAAESARRRRWRDFYSRSTNPLEQDKRIALKGEPAPRPTPAPERTRRP